jgi:cyclophilin family peptidyl-prolyl cis-trans isomerase
MKVIRLLVGIGLLFVVQAIAWAQDARIVFKIENKGEFTITLNTKAAPKTCAQIMSLVDRGFYNGLRFHRAEKKPKPFLVQVGDPNTRDSDVNPDSRGGSGKGIAKEESGLPNELGAVGLASIPEEGILGDSQFYILLTPAKFLDGKYTVFGKVTSGMSVVQSVEKGDRITSAKVFRGS